MDGRNDSVTVHSHVIHEIGTLICDFKAESFVHTLLATELKLNFYWAKEKKNRMKRALRLGQY